MQEYVLEPRREVLESDKSRTVGDIPGLSDIDEIVNRAGQKDGESNIKPIFGVETLRRLDE